MKLSSKYDKLDKKVDELYDLAFELYLLQRDYKDAVHSEVEQKTVEYIECLSYKELN